LNFIFGLIYTIFGEEIRTIVVTETRICLFYMQLLHFKTGKKRSLIKSKKKNVVE